MNEEIKKDRSPNYPKMSLAQALELAKQLYTKAGKAKISPIVAVGALGYNGMNGAALGTLGGISQYGLIDRERGKSVSISSLAIKLIHPLNPDQEAASKREAALLPQVFNDLYSSGFQKCDIDVICNNLIQNGFTPDGARKAATVFKENVVISNLCDEGILSQDEPVNEDEDLKREKQNDSETVDNPAVSTPKKKETMLAIYSIPLIKCEAKLEFSGECLTPQDFEILVDYVELFKKRFERRMAGTETFSGNVATAPRETGGRITFLLALPDGQVLSCLSGAGTKFSTSQFVNGEKITVIGERKADLTFGETPFFVFSEFKK